MRARLTRTTVAASAARLAAMAGTLLASALLISNLPAAELGLYFGLLTYGYLANASLGVGFDQWLQRRYLRGLQEGMFPMGHYGVMLIAFLISSFGIATILAPWASVESIPLIGLLAFSTFALTSLRALNLILDGQRTLNALVMLEGCLKPVLLACAVLLLRSKTHTAAILALTATQLLVAAVGLDALRRHTRRQSHSVPGPAAGAVRLIAPISAGALLNLVQLQGYRPYLNATGHADVVGIYSAIANLGGVAMQSLGAVYNQTSMKQLYDGGAQGPRRYFRGALVMMLPCLLLVAVSIPVFLLVSRKEYLHLWYIALFGVVVEAGNIFLGAAGIYLSVAHGLASRVFLFGLVGLGATMTTLALCTEPPAPWQIGASLAVGQIAAVLVAMKTVRQASLASPTAH